MQVNLMRWGDTVTMKPLSQLTKVPFPTQHQQLQLASNYRQDHGNVLDLALDYFLQVSGRFCGSRRHGLEFLRSVISQE